MECRRVADPFHEDGSLGVERPQMVACEMGFLAQCVLSRVDIDRHELTMVGGFQEALQSRLVDRGTTHANLSGVRVREGIRTSRTGRDHVWFKIVPQYEATRGWVA